MYEYTNPDHLSQVNDFGDEYHRPDSEVTGVDRELLTKIRSLKKRYRDFDEWCDAMTAYQEYSEYLLDKYGGKKRLKTLNQLGMVYDYIPFFPELRKIKRNRQYYKDGMSRMDKTVVDFETGDFNETNPIPEYTEVYFDIGDNKISKKDKREIAPDESINEKIADTLAVIGDFYKGRVKTTSSLSHRAQRRRILEKRYREGKPMSQWKRYKKYQKEMWLEDYTEDRVDPDAYIFYKDTTLSVKDAQEVEIYQALRNIGIRPKRMRLGKGAFKVVRRSDPKNLFKGKKKKKKKGALKDKYVKQFTDNRYDTFSQFEQDVLSLTAKVLEDD